jgi:hypothetical protein
MHVTKRIKKQSRRHMAVVQTSESGSAEDGQFVCIAGAEAC